MGGLTRSQPVRSARKPRSHLLDPEAVGEWVGLRHPTVHQYLAIADAFPADFLATVGTTSDILAAYPANVLEKVAKTTAFERRDWLERVRDGVESPRAGAAGNCADRVARHVRQLRDVCLQQQSAASATETAAVLTELLGVVRILAAQVATTGVISASGSVREGLAKARDYRSPIIRVLNWTRRLRHSLLRGRARLNHSAGKFATRLSHSMSTCISLITFIGSARQIVKRHRREALRSEGTPAEDPNRHLVGAHYE